MANITILHVSDIHYDKNEPEAQGLILSAFFDDIKVRLDASNRENTFCIISGDLVNKGNSDKVYEEFYENFIVPLSKVVPLKSIYCTPGNHDLNRNVVEENIVEHTELIEKRFEEIKFNEYINTDDNIFLRKFKPYEKFCKEKLYLPNFNLLGYCESPISELSIYFLNCSLFCSGGFKKIEDKGKLKIETSRLNKWIQDSKGRTRVLVMHHPLDYLTSFARKELKSMLLNDIDILISGHIHEQDLDHSYVSEEHNVIKIGSPQLFSDKFDLNGYSILTFDKNYLDTVEYRQWVKNQRKFMSGQAFSGTDGGVKKIVRIENQIENGTLKKLRSQFEKAMKSYSVNPNWTERTLKTSAPNSKKRTEPEKLDYITIINNPKNYHIIGAPQFGLTCYARYLALKAFEIEKQNWLYLNSYNWTYGQYHADLGDALTELALTEKEINCLMLDDWKNSLKDSHKILDSIKKKFPTANIVVLSNLSDNIVLEGLDSEESHEGFQQLYLSELSRSGLRNIVKDFNKDNLIAHENLVLDRLNIDLIDLNIHRTPINCLQLLIAFSANFEDRPVNRSKVFKQVLKVIFDNPGKLFYSDALDEENCGYVLGFFCEYLMRNNKEGFSESEFHNVCVPFCKQNYNTTNTYNLLEVLKNNQIVVDFYGQLRFRFTYWIYYFAALRMKFSSDFATFMLTHKHSLYFPEIIEFYTGIDGAREDVAKMLIENLEALSKSVHGKIGLQDAYNPFKEIKWALNETTIGLTQKQLIENVQKSKLPDELKDVVADQNYNSIKPYNQKIETFFEEYDVKNLMNLTRSASKGLRNSEFISSTLKEQLVEKIFLGWQEIIRALILIAPVLAKNGFGGVGGARFKLTDDFPVEYDECLKSVITSMPQNLLYWYKDDIFSDKLIMLLRKYLSEHQDPNIKHLIALLECSSRPKNWKDSVLNYVEKIDKNSFYLGDLYSNLVNNYTTSYMNSSEVLDTEYLIKACWAKHHTGSPKPGIDTVAKVSDDVLPDRNLNKLTGI